MGLCLHPLASVASSIKWVLSLPKISVKFSACGDHSINDRCCQYLLRSFRIFWLIWLQPEGGDQGFSSSCIYFTASEAVGPPPLIIVPLGEEGIIHSTCKWKNRDLGRLGVCTRSYSELQAPKPLPGIWGFINQPSSV